MVLPPYCRNQLKVRTEAGRSNHLALSSIKNKALLKEDLEKIQRTTVGVGNTDIK